MMKKVGLLWDVLAFGRCRVLACGRCRVLACGRCRVLACSRCRVLACGRCRVLAYSRCRVLACSRCSYWRAVDVGYWRTVDVGYWRAVDVGYWRAVDVGYVTFTWGWRLRVSFIHLVVCLTTGPKPLPKRALYIMRSRASSFKLEYPLLSLRSSSSFLRLLPRLLFTSIPPFIFPSITCCRRQFLHKMWPIHLAFLLLISCRIFLCARMRSKIVKRSKFYWEMKEYYLETSSKGPNISSVKICTLWCDRRSIISY